MGGDEFTILLEAISDPSDAMRAANRILSAVAEPFLVEGREVRTSASVGIALGTTVHERAEDLLQDADIAMRRAKAMGGGRCELFDEAMHARAINRLKLESELREAMLKRQFRVYYQPIVILETKRIVGFEALLRWQHPEQGLISPRKFIEAVEDTGLLVSTGQWVISEACRQFRTWKIEIPAMGAVSLNVNISAKQLAETSFVSGLEATLRQSGIDPAQVCLEITENVAASQPKLTATVFAQLKQLRIGVTVDDFGSGISSLRALRQLPVEALKIDRALVGALLLDRSALDTVELILLLARKLKLKVIAEGIESTKQLEHLLALGCELGQGYLFSQPVEAKAAGVLLRESSVLQARVAGAQ
jgi:EAL domain-containing protein (putative c-di-GMP-specific phosphodiesterase class I)